jgi:type II secretory pathway component GspD/PulD (secretin)
VTVPNKSTVVLGGLITESNRDGKTGLPMMVHVPLLKHLFGSNSKERQRQELLIFIQPHIVDNSTDLVNANLELTESNQVTRSAMEFGQRNSGSTESAKKEKAEPKKSVLKRLFRRSR